MSVCVWFFLMGTVADYQKIITFINTIEKERVTNFLEEK